MFYPERLNQGDYVGLIAPAGPVENMDKVIQSVKGMGYKPVPGESCYGRKGYLAGEDRLRAEDMNRMFADEKIKGVFAVRGGYGCQRIMNLIDFELIKNNPKIFAGYSDITVLLNAINKVCSFVTYHGPMLSTEIAAGADRYTLQSFIQCLERPDAKGEFVNPGNKMMKMFGGEEMKGRIAGGNLTLLATSLGTWYEADFEDKILFIEEVGESPYKVDRMLTQLINSGRLDKIRGVIAGVFKDCEAEDTYRSLSINEVLFERLSVLNVPVLYGLSAGHVMPAATIPIGGKVEIKKGRMFML